MLCAREIQNSIQDSVHRLLCDQIALLGVQRYFDIGQREIKAKMGGGFIFEGLRHNITKIKSMEGLDAVWVEEAEKVSHPSWEVLIPTLRKPGSEIWVSFNPNEETDPTYVRFIKNPPPGAKIVEINWRDNPWFPDDLRAEMQYLASIDPDAYQHVWEGKCKIRGDSQVLNGKWHIESFSPEKGWDGPYLGADWGFAKDPTTLVKCWIWNRCLWVEHEAYGIGVDIDRTAALFDSVPDARRYTIRADNARPETISYMQRHGYPQVLGVTKWPGSVEDGIAAMRSFDKIIIHPRCRKTADEARLYRYKVDRLTEDVLPVVEDMHNHCIDAIRYAIEPLIKKSQGQGLFDLLKRQYDAMQAEKAKQ